MFIRFASPYIHHESRRETGIFQTAYRLKRSGRLTEDEYDQLCNLLHDVECDLAVPACYRDAFIRESRKGETICWFKTQAREMIRSMWNVAWFLKEHGYSLMMIRTELPGRVMYEDRHQVAAVPFRRARQFRKWI